MKIVGLILLSLHLLGHLSQAGFRCTFGNYVCRTSCLVIGRTTGFCDQDGECICKGLPSAPKFAIAVEKPDVVQPEKFDGEISAPKFAIAVEKPEVVQPEKFDGEMSAPKFAIAVEKPDVVQHEKFDGEMCLTSPGYPSNYPVNSNTTQHFSLPNADFIEITFEDL